MVSFIGAQRAHHGVESICRQLPIAPSTYYEAKVRQADPAKQAARAKRDAVLLPEIRRVYDENFQIYGAKKVWRQLHRESWVVARCTVERLMGRLGLSGAVRGSPLAEDSSQAMANILTMVPGSKCDEENGDNEAVASLRPDVRGTWLAEHPLPAGIHYFSVITFPQGSWTGTVAI